MTTKHYNVESVERALENVVQCEQYVRWYDSTPAGRARQHKKTKLDGALTPQNMVGNSTILPHQNDFPTSTSITDNLSCAFYDNTNIAPQQQIQGKISELESKAPVSADRSDTQEMTKAKTSFGLTASLTVRATCTKDRHSKVRTAKGLRDRRVRLSAPTAVRFFDVQDRLGYDQPSRAMDWLIQKAQAAIKELAPVKPIALVGNKRSNEPGTIVEEISGFQDADEQYEKEERGVATSSPTGSAQAISRVRAQDTAKGKANRDHTMQTEAQTSALPPGRTSPAVFMLPEVVGSQCPHPISEPVASHLISSPQQSNFSFDANLPRSTTTNIMPPFAHYFHNTPFIFHDFPTPISSATSSYYTNSNTLISPGGTLQSIFIDSITSPVPVMQSYDVMEPHCDTREAAGPDGN